MKLVIDNTITYEADPLEYARDTLRRYKRGEIRAYAFRIFMNDGSHMDLVDGMTEEDKEQARTDMLMRFETQAESEESASSAPTAVPQVHELFENKTTARKDVLSLPLKQRFGS
jgi:hypothetical protein